MQPERNNIKHPERGNKPLPADSKELFKPGAEENLILIQDEQIFRRIFETANEGIWIVDLKGKILMANNQVSKTLGRRTR